MPEIPSKASHPFPPPRTSGGHEPEDLLAAAKSAQPNDRIAYRDSIAGHGGAAISALLPWLSDRTLASFAVRAIGAAGMKGAREAAIAALRTTPRIMPTSVLADAEAELASLGEKGGLGSGVDVKLREYLIEAATAGRFVTYTDAAGVAGLNMKNPHHRHTVIGGLLGAISDAEVLDGRPMLSSIVIAKGGGVHLGTGFTNLAEQLGLKPIGSDPDEFAHQEAERTFAYWKQIGGAP